MGIHSVDFLKEEKRIQEQGKRLVALNSYLNSALRGAAIFGKSADCPNLLRRIKKDCWYDFLA